MKCSRSPGQPHVQRVPPEHGIVTRLPARVPVFVYCCHNCRIDYAFFFFAHDFHRMTHLLTFAVNKHNNNSVTINYIIIMCRNYFQYELTLEGAPTRQSCSLGWQRAAGFFFFFTAQPSRTLTLHERLFPLPTSGCVLHPFYPGYGAYIHVTPGGVMEIWMINGKQKASCRVNFVWFLC